MKKIKLSSLLLLGLVLFTGCYPKDDLYIQDLDLVLTKYDENADFKSKMTYSMPDSIPKIFTAEVDGDGPDYVKQSAASLVLTRIAANMASYGYTRVDQSQNPDVTLLVASMESTTTYYMYDYYYWGWYYPYYWYYPYGGMPYSTTTSSGSILTLMLANGQVNEADRVPVIWTSLCNGLLGDGSASVSTRVNAAIDQSFVQSAYLKH